MFHAAHAGFTLRHLLHATHRQRGSGSGCVYRWNRLRKRATRPLQRFVLLLLGVAIVLLLGGPGVRHTSADEPANLRTENLVAWCIVPFDSQKRGPAARAEMLKRLGLRRVAYDWRAEHVATFEEEILQYQQHGLEYFAFWGAHDEAFRLFQKYRLKPQIWQTLGSPPAPAGLDPQAQQTARVKAAAEQLLSLVKRTQELGFPLGLYNHGGWGGEPANLIAVCEHLRKEYGAQHVGIVYNQHHGHAHVQDFAASLERMKPYLLCLNLNGMTRDGDQRGQKILPLGEGEFDLTLLRTIRDSGYSGPIGIIGHTQDDVELRLRDNLDGLAWLRPQLAGRPAGSKPSLRTWSPVSAAAVTNPSAGLFPAVTLPGKAAYRQPPLTVQCRATLSDHQGYNILVASDTKASGDHWELFSMVGSGHLTVYLPGHEPDHVRSNAMICDGRPHTMTMLYEPQRVRLLVDGQVVADQAVRRTPRPAVAGGLAVGGLVEGGIGCRGQIHAVHIARGIRELGASAETDFVANPNTELLWHAPVKPNADSTQRSGNRPETASPAMNGATPRNTSAGTPTSRPAANPATNRSTKPATTPTAAAQAETSPGNAASASGATSAEEKQRIAALLEQANRVGEVRRGLFVFRSEKAACLSCHKIGKQGGIVGPELSQLAKQRTAEEIVESVLWPQRQVKPEFVAHQIIDADGRSHQGYIVRQDPQQVVLRDPTRPAAGEIVLPVGEIELQRQIGTLMPENLTAAMTDLQLQDLIRFLTSLGKEEGLAAAELDSLLQHAQIHQHGPATFPLDRSPQQVADWPSWEAPVNRDRVYDFYSKQADYFRQQQPSAQLLAEFPGLDGGMLGHWGNQNEAVWASDAWNQARLGSLQAGIFRGAGKTIPRGVCIQLTSKTTTRENDQAKPLTSDRSAGQGGTGEADQQAASPPAKPDTTSGPSVLSVCFDPETLSYPVTWQDGFVKFSTVRHGFMHGLALDGVVLDQTPLTIEITSASTDRAQPKEGAVPAANGETKSSAQAEEKAEYRGFYRVGSEVVFAYRRGDALWLDQPKLVEGRIHRIMAPETLHPVAKQLHHAPAQWPEEYVTPITLGTGSPYAVDTIGLPWENRWNIPIFIGGHAFLPDGSALVCTIQGDVWRVRDFAYPSRTARWRRFASGLNQPLGMVIDQDGIFVLGRDQITRLHDLNSDGEADFYECFSRAYETSPAGHDFICGLERDAAGYFYTASGNQGLVRVSPDGRQAEVLATGFRNPDGLGVLPDGTVTVPCSEGDWTPASMICAVRPRHASTAPPAESAAVPHYGWRGPKDGQPPSLPLVYLPRGLDNSCGGQTTVTSSQWGPLEGQLIHFSFGTGAHFLVLRNEVAGQLQGAVVPLVGEFRSGAHRGRFHPDDGQLYVTGMQGWGSYTTDPGCFQRVRYTGAPVQLPIGFHIHENGIAIRFSQPLDASFVGHAAAHFAQCWNYRYGPGYGSPEFSTQHQGVRGHDRLTITAAHLLDDQRTLFLELPELQPVNLLHVRVQAAESQFRDLFITVHRLDEPRTDLPGYQPVQKVISPHPILADLALATRSVPNPYRGRIANARPMTIRTGSQLSFETRTLRAQAGERIALTLENPDVVPHNWALVKPGTLDRVGNLANLMIGDPEAALRHYVPQSSDVLAYTDVVLPRDQFTIYFTVPDQPGRYPFLCTFPGHWKVMNGELLVE